MSLADFLDLFVQLILLLVAALTLLDLLRYRTRQKLDIAAMFSSLVIIILVGRYSELTGSDSVWPQVLGAMAIVAHPYLLLRLVHHLRPTPRLARWLSLGGLLIFWAVLISIQTVPPYLLIPLVAYFVILEGYATSVMIERARSTGGINRRRLFLAASGPGLLAVLILLALFTGILPTLEPYLSPLSKVLGVLIALGFYLGFAPPRWLRRIWQQAELFKFLNKGSNRVAVSNPDEIVDRLCRAAIQFTGSPLSAVALWNPTEENLALQTSTGQTSLTINPNSLREGAVKHAWNNHEATLAQTPTEFGSNIIQQMAAEVEANSLLAVPITASQAHGILVAFLRTIPLFVADDLVLLSLVAEQTAIALDYVILLAEQQTVSIQLQASNQELESFAYSVSHDLRAPLRAVDGFSQTLLEDNGDQLDDQGKAYLERVRANVQRMGELIDALLTLSRLTRVEMNRECVDLSALARTIASQLQKRDPDRQVEFIIEENIEVDGDPRLLEVALENLLENAWKFSSKRDQTRIEFRGTENHEEQPAYFVRDNGAGFDMAYANKLFGAFQRLHAMSDFAGTGIGLATVKRIIHRHGGQLWAEGVPNEGATFYFTL
ncbi:MAG: ATP-binding protein [Candidatus Promineifilaceae bacterium]